MRTHFSSSPFRVLRTAATPALAGAVALGVAVLAWPGTAGATGSAPTTPGASAAQSQAGPQGQAGLQAQAEEIASQITADGVTLDQLDAQYSEATMRVQQLTAQRAALQKSMARTDTQMATALQTLKQQALLAYLSGGGPVLTFQSGEANRDPSLTLAYADIVVDGEKTAAQTYKASLTDQAAESRQLAANAASARITLDDLRSSQQQAQATMASRQQALAGVKGRLAAAVDAVEAQDQQEQQAEEQATLAAAGQALPPTRAPKAARPAATPTTVSTPRHLTTPTTARPRTTTTHPTTTDPPRKSTAKATTTTTTTAPPPSGQLLAQAPGASAVIAYARSQLGKPYQWAGAGPDSFDCSGLVMMAWEQAGIYFPHLAQDQYDLTERIALSDLEPGDLVFFGTPDDVYHVGIYVGGGDMIDAPETGQNVSVQSIYWTDLLGGGRVTVDS